MTGPIVLAFLVAINAIAFLAFWHDKRCAIAGRRRVPEADLLGLAIMGGSAGALIARQLFRHKTRKQPFATYILLIPCLQAGAAIGWFLL